MKPITRAHARRSPDRLGEAPTASPATSPPAADLCLNIAAPVRFRVTTAGEHVWRRHLESLGLRLADHPLQRDDRGLVTMPLWEVIHVFGTELGAPGPWGVGRPCCIERDELFVAAEDVRPCGGGK